MRRPACCARYLIANEAYVKIPALDHLGSLYLEALNYYGTMPLTRFRYAVIDAIANELMHRRNWLRDKRLSRGTAGLGLGIMCGLATLFLLNYYELNYPTSKIILYFAAFTPPVFAAVGAVYGAILDLPERRYRDLRVRLDRLLAGP